jgi:hypothetical protein
MKQFKTVKEALEFVGGLSNPSKMPCYSYGISAKLCDTGSKLVDVVGSVCEGCYALKGMYGDWNKAVSGAHERRYEAMKSPDWVGAMVFLINKKKMEYFRWHDSGDLQSFQHLLNLVTIAEQCPGTSFWLPTREKKYINQYQKAFGDFPSNLVVRVSATMIDDKAGDYPNTSTVHQDKPAIGHECPAPKQGGKCGDCRSCWDKSVVNVSYKKH